MTDFGGFIGDLPGSQGTATVSGAGSTWTNTGTIEVGVLGAGTLTIENGGTVNSGGGGSIGLSAGSTGTVTVTGPGSTWNNSPGGGLNIGSFGTGTLTIANGGTVINNTAFAANIGNGAGSQGTVTVTGAGSTWSNSSGLNIGNLGTGTLTIADSGAVTAGPVVIATNAGVDWNTQHRRGRGQSSGCARHAHGAERRIWRWNRYDQLQSHVRRLRVCARDQRQRHGQCARGLHHAHGRQQLQRSDECRTRAALRAGALNTFSPNSAVTVASGGTLDLNGFSQTVSGLANAGLVNMGTGTAPGTVLTTTSYTELAARWPSIHSSEATARPPTDWSSAAARPPAATTVHVTNVGGPGAETTGNGIQVVNAINGATTAPGAFALPAGEFRAGAFDYDLFRGGVCGAAPTTGSCAPTSSCRRCRPEPPVPPIPPIPPFPPDPPPNPLPPGVYPIIGPELATYGVVQPLARQLGLAILGTLDDRVGDTYSRTALCRRPRQRRRGLICRPASLFRRKRPPPAPCPLFSPSVWGRFFGQTIHNHYQAFADPSANGDLGGFQGGIDLLRGSLIAGHYERAGLYGAYGDVHADVDGLVTNPAATAYILAHTGSMNLDAWSAGGYWTHTGPGGWYLDAVLQGTWYYGSAATQFARLDTDGTGFIASLESGYPYAWPQLGPGFVLEPQGQILWQKVSFRHDYDGLGDVALGDTTGPSGRVGLRGQMDDRDRGGQVWQPYLRANVWRDWGAEANTVYSGTDVVPLVSQVTSWSLAAA